MIPAEIAILILVLFLIGRWIYGLIKDEGTKAKFSNFEKDFADLWEKYRTMEQRVSAIDRDVDDIDERLDRSNIAQARSPTERREHRPPPDQDWTRPSKR